MKHEYAHDGREHAVELTQAADGAVVARVTGGGEPVDVALHATRLGEGRWLVRMGDAVHEVRVEPGAGDALRVRLREGDVALERLDPFRDAVRGGKDGARGARKVMAPIPGRVVSVLVEVGAEVAAGQPLVVVEAMKMANELRSPAAGRVTRVEAVAGAAVEAGALLVVVEAG